MRRRSKKSKTRKVAERSTLDVVTQLEIAIRNPLATTLGAAIGGIVPWFGRELAHGELDARWYADPRLIVVAGCMLFSMISVYGFGRAAFGNPRKALGFVAALEGVMLCSHGRIGVVALIVLIAINAIANGCTIACGREATTRRREADVRRSATRARHREERVTSGRERSPAKAPAIAVEHGRAQSAHAPTAAPIHQPRWVRVPSAAMSDASDAEFVEYS